VRGNIGAYMEENEPGTYLVDASVTPATNKEMYGFDTIQSKLPLESPWMPRPGLRNARAIPSRRRLLLGSALQA